MNLGKQEYWWFWLLLDVITGGISSFALASYLHVYEPGAWYTKWEYWLIGGLCCFFPAYVMLVVFLYQTKVAVAKKVGVAGSSLYASPYTWLLCMIVPLIGWTIMIAMIIYIWVFTYIKMANGDTIAYEK